MGGPLKDVIAAPNQPSFFSTLAFTKRAAFLAGLPDSEICMHWAIFLGKVELASFPFIKEKREQPGSGQKEKGVFILGNRIRPGKRR